MEFTEKMLIATYLYKEHDVELKNRILDIPKKHLSKATVAILNEFKKLELNNQPLTDISKKYEYHKELCDAIDETYLFLPKDIETFKNSLRRKYLKKEATRIGKLETYEVENEIANLYSEMVRSKNTGVKKASSKEAEKIFFDSFNQADFVRTGEARFSNAVKLTKRDLHVIGARPGVGKSAFALYLTLMLAKYNRGIFFSLEMPITQITKRIVASQTKIPLKKMDTTNDLSAEEKTKIKKYFEEYQKLDLTIYDGNFKIEKLEEIVKFEKEINGLDFIVVDYLQLIQSKKVSRYEQITDVSIRLKQLAKEHDITVIALSQLSREIEKRVGKEIYLSDFRDSGQIEQDASVILGLTTEEILNSPTKDSFLMTVSILKNRQGRMGKMLYSYCKSNQSFYPEYSKEER